MSQPTTCRNQAMTLAQLAAYYNVSRTTMRKWLKPFRNEIGPVEGNFYTPKQVQVIFDKIGD